MVHSLTHSLICIYKDNSGMLSRDEIKGLFSAVSGFAVEEIDDEHPELVAMSGITTGELVHKIWQKGSRKKLEPFHKSLGLVYHRPATLLQPHPDRDRCRKIVEAVDKNGDGNISRTEVKSFLGQLCEVEPDDISDENEEFQLFADLTSEEMVDVLVNRVSKDTVDRYFFALFPSLFKQEPDRAMVEKIVRSLDADGDGTISLSEIKVLFAKMTERESEDISDENTELLSYQGMTVQDLITKLTQNVPKATIEKYHEKLFPTLSVFKPPADRSKVEQIVKAFASEESGSMSLEGVRLLFGKVSIRPQTSALTLIVTR